MNLNKLLLIVWLAAALSACSEHEQAAQGSTDLAAEVQAPLDKAASVNEMVNDQDAAQRQRMDEQGQ